MAGLPVPKRNAICACVSQTDSFSIRTSIFTDSSGWYRTMSHLFSILIPPFAFLRCDRLLPCGIPLQIYEEESAASKKRDGRRASFSFSVCFCFFYNFGKAVMVSGVEPSDKKRAGGPKSLSGHPLSTRINSYCNPV